MTTKNLDMLGEVCPIPLIMTQQELVKMNSGDNLLVKTDFNQTVRNILKWCEDQGYKFEIDEADNGIWLISITKN